jgi:hypothetical protein
MPAQALREAEPSALPSWYDQISASETRVIAGMSPDGRLSC